MNRKNLIEMLAEQTHLTKREAEWFVRAFFNTLMEGLKLDGRIEIRGFGVFKTLQRKQAGFKNPKDGCYYGGMSLKTVKFYPSSVDESGTP